LIYSAQVLTCDCVNRGAVARAIIRQIKQRPDLINRKAEIAGAPNKAKTRKPLAAIHPVIGARTLRLPEQSNFFIPADCLDLGACRAGECANAKPAHDTAPWQEQVRTDSVATTIT
jgi:hypothetical protein